MDIVIVGYTSKDNTVFCVRCWSHGHREAPDRVLDTEYVVESDDDFWVADFCVRCGTEVRYKEARPAP